MRTSIRTVSTTILVPIVSKFSPLNNRLRVPLLKAPLHLGHYSSRLTRRTNEDAYSASLLSISALRHVFCFGVYDGHGGSECADYLARVLPHEIERCATLCSHPSEQKTMARHYAQLIGGYWKRWLKHLDALFAAMHSRASDIVLTHYDRIQDDMHLRLPLAYLHCDYFLCQGEEFTLGSTCTQAFLETLRPLLVAVPTPVEPYFARDQVAQLTVAQVGDSRAILVDRNGLAHGLTTNHHPLNPHEAQRLQRYAADCFLTDSFGEERFVALANTRAFGDANYKHMGVSAEPEVRQWVVGCAETIRQTMLPREIAEYTIGGKGGDEGFLVLCLDGVTNFVSDQEVADIVMARYNNRPHSEATAQACAAEVVHFVEYIGGNDNATCIVIRLAGWGKWDVLDRTGELRQSRMDGYRPRGRG